MDRRVADDLLRLVVGLAADLDRQVGEVNQICPCGRREALGMTPEQRMRAWDLVAELW